MPFSSALVALKAHQVSVAETASHEPMTQGQFDGIKLAMMGNPSAGELFDRLTLQHTYSEGLLMVIEILQPQADKIDQGFAALAAKIDADKLISKAQLQKVHQLWNDVPVFKLVLHDVTTKHTVGYVTKLLKATLDDAVLRATDLADKLKIFHDGIPNTIETSKARITKPQCEELKKLSAEVPLVMHILKHSKPKDTLHLVLATIFIALHGLLVTLQDQLPHLNSWTKAK